MSEFDTGSNWKDNSGMDPEEQEFMEAMNLTEDEMKVAERIQKQMQEVASNFTFWMREQKATPKEYKFKFNVVLRGEVLEKWMWLKHFVIDGGWGASSDMIGTIMSEGIKAVYEAEQRGHAAASLAAETMKYMPMEVAKVTVVGRMRDAIKHRKEIEERTLRESLEGG